MGNPEKLTYNDSRTFILGSNHFIDTPVVLQHDDKTLIETFVAADASYDAVFTIYHESGDYLAKVKGTQLYETEASRKHGVRLRHSDKMTVCEMNGRTVFEVRREKAATLKASAELYTPYGLFIRASDDSLGSMSARDDQGLDFTIGNVIVVAKDLTITGAEIGLHYIGNGLELFVGRNGQVSQAWREVGLIDTRNSPQTIDFIRVPPDPETGRTERSGFAIEFQPDPARRKLRLELYPKLASIVDEIESERGPFDLFLLRSVPYTGDVCDLMVSAPWIGVDPQQGLHVIVERLKARLSEVEMALFSNYTTPETDSLSEFRARFAHCMEEIPSVVSHRIGSDPTRFPTYHFFRCTPPG